MNLGKLFNPQSIAIVGASEEAGKVGNVIAKNILKLGYAGRVFLVNPKYDKLFGQKCYKNLVEIDDQVDLAIFAIPAKFVNSEIKNNAKKIKNFVVISAGFSEVGKEGRAQEDEMAKIAKENKLNILGPNCLGFIIPQIKLNASFATGLPEEGGISFVTQSGALAVALMDAAKAEGLKFSSIVSVGNKMEISETEMLEFLVRDKNTKVIGMYLEGIKNGKEFAALAQKVSKIKPIVILKAGKSEKTQKAISSHTGALAGDDDIVSAVFEKAGIVRANNLKEFFNLLNLFENSEKISSEKTIVITNAGGVGVLTADAFLGKDIKLADLDDKIKTELRKILPAESSVENPIDLLGDAKTDRYQNVLEKIDKISGIGSIICLLTPQDQTPVLEIAETIIKFQKKTKKLVTTVFLGGEKVEKAIVKIKKKGICNFSFPNEAVETIDKYYLWNKLKNVKRKTNEQIINKKRREKVLAIIEKAKSEKRKALYFSESVEIMNLYQVETVEFEEVSPEKKLLKTKISFPVVLKVDSDKIMHKTDKQGLVLNIANKKQLQEELQKMDFNFPKSKFIIQPMMEKGTEIIIGIKKDENFGPVVVYGLGGIYTEVFKMVERVVPPLTLSQIENSLMSGKLKFLFEVTRGQKEHNLEEIAKIILGIGSMALEIPEIREFDINPLTMYNNGKKALALDVKVMI